MYGEMSFFTQNSLHHNKLLSLMLPWLYKLQTKLSNSSVILSCKCQCSPNFSKIFFYATFFAIILNGFNFPKPATTFILPQPASTWRLTRAVLVKLSSALLTRKLYAAFNDSFTLLILIILTLLLFPVLKQMFGLFFFRNHQWKYIHETMNTFVSGLFLENIEIFCLRFKFSFLVYSLFIWVFSNSFSKYLSYMFKFHNIWIFCYCRYKILNYFKWIIYYFLILF